MASIIVPFAQITSSGALPVIGTLGLTPKELVAEIHISPNDGNSATISVYDVASSIVLKSLRTPANGHTDSWCFKSGEDQDGIDPTRIGVTVSGSDKANAYAIVR